LRKLLNIEFKKFGVFGFMDVVENDRLSRQKYNSIHGSISKIFLVFQNYFDSSDDISLFLILKISALYIFFGFIFIDSRNVLRNLQRLPNKEK
jgi:hypothetical protein